MNEPADQTPMAKVVYILYLVALVTGGLTAIVGVVLAHVYHDAAGDPVRSHFRYQFRTFWIGLLYSAIATLTMPILIGGLLWMGLLVWVVVRCIKGLRLLGERRPVDEPATWWV